MKRIKTDETDGVLAYPVASPPCLFFTSYLLIFKICGIGGICVNQKRHHHLPALHFSGKPPRYLATSLKQKSPFHPPHPVHPQSNKKSRDRIPRSVPGWRTWSGLSFRVEREMQSLSCLHACLGFQNISLDENPLIINLSFAQSIPT